MFLRGHEIYPYFNMLHPLDTVTVTVNFPEPIFCNDMTVDELIASGNYNVIDN